MISIPKPMISCAGHEGLVSELELRFLISLASEPTLWRYSKHNSPYAVHIEACFARFSAEQLQSPVKVLSSGRPIRRLGSVQPLLYIYVISNNHTEYISGGVKQKIANWLSHLHAQNITDWLILMIDANSHSNVPKMWSRFNLPNQIRQDFHLPPTGQQVLQLPDRRAVDEKVFQEAWTSLIRSLRKIIMEVFHLTIQDYNAHIQLLKDAQASPGWDFFEYLNRKEEVAELYLAVKGFEDALHEYYELEALFTNTTRGFQGGADSQGPGWIEKLRSRRLCENGVYSFLSNYPFVNPTSGCHSSRLVRTRKATVFDIRAHLLAREFALLKTLNRVHEFPARALSHINSALEESKKLELCSTPVPAYCWAFLCSLNCLELMGTGSAEQAIDSADSLSTVLGAAVAAACGLQSPAARQTDPLFTVGETAVSVEASGFQLTDNVFLRVPDTVNPIAPPLAALVHRIYTRILSSTNMTSKTLSSAVLSTIRCARISLVNLWTVVFVQLTRLGHLLSLWSMPKEAVRHSNLNLLTAIKMSIISSPHSADHTTSAVHKHLTALLSSQSVYGEIYVAVAQTLIGFLRLLDQPRKAIYVWCLLANFLQHVQARPDACDIYSTVLAVYLRHNWPQLSVRVYLQLAYCLRMGIRESQGNVDALLEDFLKRYFHCCIVLSWAPPACLEAALHSLKPTSNELVDLNRLTADWDPTISLDDFSSNDFWWSEAISTQRTLTDAPAWNASSMSSLPFIIERVTLEGACENGFQRVRLVLENRGHVSYKVRLQLIAAHPTEDDWRSLMNYGLVEDPTSSSRPNTPVLESKLSTVDLTSTPTIHIPPSDSFSPDVAGIRPVSFAVQRGNEFSDHPRSSSLLHADQERRRSSLLDLAASWATRPTWRSQDQLLGPDALDEKSAHNPVANAAENIHSNNRSSSSLAPPAFLRSAFSRPNFDQVKVKRSSSVSDAYDNARHSFPAAVGHTIGSSSVGSLPPWDSDVHAYFLKVCADSNSSLLFTTEKARGDNDTVTFGPGQITVTLLANSPGFLIPTTLRVGIFEAVMKGTTVSQTPIKPLFTFCYSIQKWHFDSSWSNRELLDSLLPQVRTVHSAGQQAPINVVLGLRELVPIELEVGLLRFPLKPIPHLNLCRIVSKKANPVHNVKLVNGYVVTAQEHTLVLSPTILLDGKVINSADATFDFTLVHQDGPVTIVAAVDDPERVPDASDVQTEALPHTLIRLSRPVWMSAVTDHDEFALSMPSGYFCRLPVKVIRPLAIHLTVYASRKSEAVLFGIRIACMDVSNSGALKKIIVKPTAKPACPLTYVLSKFELVVSGQYDGNNLKSNPIYKPTRSGSTTNFSSTSPATTGTSLARTKDSMLSLVTSDISDEVLLSENCIFGSPVDPRCTEVHVNRLCPVTLFWRFELDQFRPFVDKFNGRVVTLFHCTFRRLDDPNCESQLTFTRVIKKSVTPMGQRQASMSNILGRARK
ncbi:trafficking protein particle complex subunit 10 [Paragonimus westermani]|uniref:Trafficking protein particle complex subunit 10 n=1 Tax=Paragonimus westermani TaxID=34504 RepID=A0A5J4NQ56_9TREM|nr:trafficking protein particle complex subunit 10 [Paragonimus westermani]